MAEDAGAVSRGGVEEGQIGATPLFEEPFDQGSNGKKERRQRERVVKGSLHGIELFCNE